VPYWVGLINSMCRSKKKGVANDARKWWGRATRLIFGCRETAAGVCWLPRTVCKSVRERRCDGAGCLLTIGIGQHRWACTCWRGVAVDATDSRPSRSGGAECRTQSARAPKSNGATAQAVCRPVGYACARSSCQRVCMCVRLHVCVPAPMGACVCVCARECAHVCSLGNELPNQMPCLSLSSAEASPTRETLHCKICFSQTLSVVDATDSRTTRTSSGAARVSVSGGAMLQAVCLPRVSGHTDACTHVDVGW